MKKLHIFILPALMFCCLSASAAKPKKNKKVEEAMEVVDTLSVDEFSFLFGRVNAPGLKSHLVQRMGIDARFIEDFMEGFMEGEQTETDRRMKARLAGKEIRAQFNTQIIPQANMLIDEDADLVNREKIFAGLRAGLMEENTDGISMDSAMTLVDKQVEYYHNTNMEKKYGDNRRAGEQFLKENAKKKDVKVTESGLQYKILTKGEGAVPTATDKVRVHYRGTLLDGTEFDSSYSRGEPTEFGCGQVIRGWTEALTMMPVGSKWMLYIPQELAYGDRQAGEEIKPFSALIFEVELLDIVK